MKTLRVMDSTGDTVIKFDEAQADAKATQEAKELFERMTKKSAAVFSINRGKDKSDKRVTNFSELEQENVIVPLIVGG